MDYREALSLNETQLNDLRALGYAYLKQGAYETALPIFNALSVIGPAPYDLQMLGAIHLQMNDNIKALSFLEQALKMEPNHAPTQLNRAKALMALGYTQQARLQAEELAGYPDVQISSSAQALLLSLKI